MKTNKICLNFSKRSIKIFSADMVRGQQGLGGTPRARPQAQGDGPAADSREHQEGGRQGQGGFFSFVFSMKFKKIEN